MSSSALLSSSARLGLGATQCGSSVGALSERTCTRSPPMALATAARSGVVVTTLNAAAAVSRAPKRSAVAMKNTSAKRIMRFSSFDRSERVSAVGADGDLRRQEACPDGLTERRVARALHAKAGVFARRVAHRGGDPRTGPPPLGIERVGRNLAVAAVARRAELDRKSTRLNSSHVKISYAVFCLKKKNE